MCNLAEAGHTFEFAIGDDGSQVVPASEFFAKNQPLPFMHLYRVKKDLGFNSHGTRNLLMKQTNTNWNVLSDIDREYPDDTLIDIMAAEHREFDPSCRYLFCRGRPLVPSLNDYVIHKEAFWKSGGYDEEFVNHHFGDRIFLESLALFATPVVMDDWLIEYPRGARKVLVGDVETTQYPDDNTLILPRNRFKSGEEKARLVKFVEDRNKTHEGRMSKKVINFEWEQVF